jgi:hypothetical protein
MRPLIQPLLILVLTFAMAGPASAIPCFLPPINNPIGAIAISVDDLNHDSKLDLVVVAGGGKIIDVLLGNADGTFQKAGEYPQTLFVGTVALADVNRDGHLDIVAPVADFAEKHTGVIVLLGNGDGTFQRTGFFTTPAEPGSAVVGDFNGDQKPDIAIISQNKDKVVWLPGNGDGTFGQPSPISLPRFSVPTSLSTGDLNGDGNLDFVVTILSFSGPSKAVFLLGNGDGTFQAAGSKILGGTSGGRGRLVDLNNDGKLDFIAVTPLGEEGWDGATVLMGNGDGTFRGPEILSGGGDLEPTSVVAADITGDGVPDLVDAAFTPPHLTLFRGAGDGSFPTKKSFSLDAAFIWVEAGDFNRDGKIDLVVSSAVGFTSQLQVFLNSGQCH